MSKKVFFIILLIVSVNGFTQTGKNLTTSIFPIFDITRQIAPDSWNVNFVVPAGANPHNFEPVPSTVKIIADSDLLIGIHPHFDGWMEKFVSGSVKVSYLLKEDDHSTEMDHSEEADFNPHIWLSVIKGREIAFTIAELLGVLNPESKPEIDAKLNLFLKSTEELDVSISGILNSEEQKVVQWHPAWNYFAAEYGIEICGTIQSGHGDTPSIKEFAGLIKKIREENVTVLIVGLNLQSREAETLVQETGIKILRLDSIGSLENPETDSWQKLLISNAQKLADAFKAGN